MPKFYENHQNDTNFQMIMAVLTLKIIKVIRDVFSYKIIVKSKKLENFTENSASDSYSNWILVLVQNLSYSNPDFHLILDNHPLEPLIFSLNSIDN
jgi:hypothetical protein